MAEQPQPAALDRIERALARIVAASDAQTAARAALSQRHDALRTRVSEAVAAIDALLDPA